MRPRCQACDLGLCPPQSKSGCKCIQCASLCAHAKTAGSVAASELRWQLTDRLGVEWPDVVNGLADITGVPADAIRAMSIRAAEIERAAAESGATRAEARQITAWATRTAKDRTVDPAALRPWWRERLQEVGFESTALDRTIGRASTVSLIECDEARLLERLGRSRRCHRTGQQLRPTRCRAVDRHAHFWVRIRRGRTSLELTEIVDRWVSGTYRDDSAPSTGATPAGDPSDIGDIADMRS